MRLYRKQDIQVTEDIIPLSQFKVQASRVLHSLHETGRSIVITQNGKPSAVVVTPEEFDRMRERENFMLAVEEGRTDIRAGRVIKTKTLEQELDKRFGKMK
ncbi:MAG: type II toxin-antitoxin system Phd/YefM family antitoxin [Deltaproteobacteria bacterium]|nr:type II toxin-antitoxin system Phd/YefM family antitoxin [Deltaproteobacteria bacterium]